MSDEQKDKVYQLLPTLINNAESISWNRFNNFLIFNSIHILAWVAIYTKQNPPYILLSAISVFGLIGCFVWCALGLRGRKNVNLFLKMGKDIESSDPKPFTEAIKLRDMQPFSWSGSIYVITLTPLLIAMFYALLLWMSISQLILKIIFTTGAAAFIIVFICLTLGYIKRGKEDL